jgi:hypothetical protein
MAELGIQETEGRGWNSIQTGKALNTKGAKMGEALRMECACGCDISDDGRHFCIGELAWLAGAGRIPQSSQPPVQKTLPPFAQCRQSDSALDGHGRVAQPQRAVQHDARPLESRFILDIRMLLRQHLFNVFFQ